MSSSITEEESILGKRLIIVAWIYQVFLLMIVSAILYIDTYEIDFNNTESILALLLFVFTIFVELLKVPLVRVFYEIKRLIVKISLIIVILLLTFVTYESIFSGFEVQFAINTKQPFSELKSIEEDLVNKSQKSETTVVQLSELRLKKKSLENKIFTSHIYKFTKYRMGVKSVSEVTLDNLTTTAFWWYGSLAMLVSLMGVLLAFSGYSTQNITNKE
jgi:hypothetical protein